jgi:Leucine-rich repeat (LRR) protein
MASLKLGHLNELKVLFLQGNEIAKVDGLEGCHELRELVLDKNRIKFVDPYR